MRLNLKKAIKTYNEANPDADKLTLKILSEKVGSSYQSLSNYQSGRLPDSVSRLIDIVKITGVKLVDIVEETTEESNK